MTCENPAIVATIKDGETTSEPIYVGNHIATGIIFPAAMDGTTLSIEVSHYPTAFFVALDSVNTSFTNPIQISVGKAFEILNPAKAFPFPFIRFVANATQTVDRTLIVASKG